VPLFPRPPQNEASDYRAKNQNCQVTQKYDSQDETDKQDAQQDELEKAGVRLFWF
jgi:hypothetical protein